MKKTSLALILLSGVTVLALSGCAGPNTISTKDGHYWQRTEASSAIYQRGPKAQQMLHRDIARCVYEVRELQRLGPIRSVTPGDVDINGHAPDASTPEGRMASQDTPERDGYLLAEQTDFHDFETCMKTAGWDRVEYLPYNVSTEARDTYIDTMKQEQRRSKAAGTDTTAHYDSAEDVPARQKGSLNE